MLPCMHCGLSVSGKAARQSFAGPFLAGKDGGKTGVFVLIITLFEISKDLGFALYNFMYLRLDIFLILA